MRPGAVSAGNEGAPERSFRGGDAENSRAAVVEAEALAVHFQDMDVMRQSVEQRPAARPNVSVHSRREDSR